MIFAFMPAGISSTFGGFHPEGISSAKRISLQLRKCAVACCAKTLRRTRRDKVGCRMCRPRREAYWVRRADGLRIKNRIIIYGRKSRIPEIFNLALL